jgi:hypothetical protein
MVSMATATLSRIEISATKAYCLTELYFVKKFIARVCSGFKEEVFQIS